MYLVKIKHYLRFENNTNTNHGIHILRTITIYTNVYVQAGAKKNHIKIRFRYIKLTDQLLLKPDFQKVHWHIGVKWQNHDIKHPKDQIS